MKKPTSMKEIKRIARIVSDYHDIVAGAEVELAQAKENLAKWQRHLSRAVSNRKR